MLLAVTTMMVPHRVMTVFLPEARERSSKDGMSYGSLIHYESQTIRKTVLSTTVAELYSFMKCLVHASFSVDYGWTYLVKLQTVT